MFDISLEAMQATLQSKLGKELDAIWQEVIDYRDRELKEMTFRGRYQAIKKFFLQTSVKKFKECVWKNVGVHVLDVEIQNITTSGSFASISFMNPSGSTNGGFLDSQGGFFQIEQIISGEFIKRYTQQQFGVIISESEMNTFSADQLIAIAKSFNKKTGGISESKKLEMRKIIKFNLCFDLELGFLLEDLLAKGSGVPYMTAQEITSIILHELGHLLCIVEHAADVYARTASFNYLFEAFKHANASNIVEVEKLSNVVAETLSARGDKVNAERLLTTVKKVKESISTAGSGAQPTMVKNVILGLIGSLFSIVYDVFAVPFDVLSGGEQRLRFTPGEQKKKYGDIPINIRMANWEERKADEYAFANGYGAELTSGLVKMSKFMDYFGYSEKAVAVMKTADDIHLNLDIFTRCRILLRAPGIASDTGYMLYPLAAKRFREILNLTVQQLKAHCTDSAYVTKYMKDIEFILNMIDNNSRIDEYVAKVWNGYDIFMKYFTLPSFVDWLVHGRVKREIEELINDVDKIGNNLLTYYGLKIQQIATK